MSDFTVSDLQCTIPRCQFLRRRFLPSLIFDAASFDTVPQRSRTSRHRTTSVSKLPLSIHSKSSHSVPTPRDRFTRSRPLHRRSERLKSFSAPRLDDDRINAFGSLSLTKKRLRLVLRTELSKPRTAADEETHRDRYSPYREAMT